MIELQNLTVVFNSKAVLKDLNYRFTTGQTYGIIGANGAGKTTLLKCIAGLQRPSAGAILIEANMRKHLSYLEASLTFYEKMKANEFIALCLKAKGMTDYDLERACTAFDLPVQEFIENFSTGMKKKLMLLVFLMIKDKIILFDEPFANLDAETTHFLTDAIVRLRQTGSTIIITSHDTAALLKCSDHLLLMEDGLITMSANATNAQSVIDAYRTVLDERKNALLREVKLG